MRPISIRGRSLHSFRAVQRPRYNSIQLSDEPYKTLMSRLHGGRQRPEDHIG